MAFFPIGDVHDRPMIRPFVTVGLLITNVLVFFLVQPDLSNYSAMSQIPESALAFYDRFALVPVMIANGNNLLSLVTSMFLHGGIVHLAGNMLYLWIFGDNVEHALGHIRFLLFYLATGIAASAAQVALFSDSDVWNLGASGAIAGVLGAYLVLYPRSQINVIVGRGHITRMSALVVIGLWFALQLFSGGSQLMAAGEGGVAYWAHIGGFVAGAAGAMVLSGLGIADSGRRA